MINEHPALPSPRKGDLLEGVRIETMAAEGKCLARIQGKVLFIAGGAPGDIVDVELTKIKTTFLEGRVTRVVQPSPNRSEPFCQHFGMCGGCSWQHIDYPTQLVYKHQQVIDHLERIGGLTLPPVKPILAAPREKHYRNKLDFTFTANRWLTVKELGQVAPGQPGLGYHLPRMYDKVFDVAECHLQPEPSNSIRLTVKTLAVKEQIPFFNLRLQTGFLRTLTIRTANIGEVMVILQVTYDQMAWIEKILSMLAAEFPSITSFYYVINGKRNDTFHDLDLVCWRGDPWITERMSRPDGKGSLEFRVGPKSFYQTNSEQAERLYHTAWEMAALQGNERVYDLYTGTGTIAAYVAAQAREVIGLEYVAAAIEDAKANAKLNGITNTSFFAGDLKDLLTTVFLDNYGRPDVVITDPPRAGMHEDVCRVLLETAPDRIVYVSCNPATQARDLKILVEKYEITAVQPVDMFPQTVHVENVVGLKRTG